MRKIVEKVETVLEKALDEQIFPGCAVGIRTPEKCEVITKGKFTYESTSQEINRFSVFDVASLTKVIPVSCCALRLIDQEVLSLEDQLISYVPSFRGSYREEITIYHLLTHTLDFDLRFSQYKDCAPDELLEKILTVKLKSRPGTQFCYANATSILLGLLLEKCTGKTLDHLGSEFFFEPLGMKRTGFDTSRFTVTDIVPTEIDLWRGGIVCGQVHDESAWKLQPRIVGSAGLFSTIDDILIFVDHLLKSYSATPGGMFTYEIAQMIHTNQIPQINNMFTGLGWELNQKHFMGTHCTSSTFGKTGFTGCSIVADPVPMRAVILLSNHIFPKRRVDRSSINRVRKSLADIVFED